VGAQIMSDAPSRFQTTQAVKEYLKHQGKQGPDAQPSAQAPLAAPDSVAFILAVWCVLGGALVCPVAMARACPQTGCMAAGIAFGGIAALCLMPQLARVGVWLFGGR
jgi:hypothetical protein